MDVTSRGIAAEWINCALCIHKHIIARGEPSRPGPRARFLFCFIVAVLIVRGAESNNTHAGDCVPRIALMLNFFVFADWALSAQAVRTTQRVRRIKFAPVVRFIQWPGELNLQPPFALLMRRCCCCASQPVWLRLFTRFKTRHAAKLNY
jgi:hypothetical protein